MDALTIVRNVCRKLETLGDNELDYIISKAMEIRAERSKRQRAETPTATA